MVPWSRHRALYPAGVTATAMRLPHCAQYRGGSYWRPQPPHSGWGRPQAVQNGDEMVATYPTMPPPSTPRRARTFPAAARRLAERDAVLAMLVDTVGLPKLGTPFDSHFAALVRSIVYQQLAGKAAATIHARLVAALDDDVSPRAVLALASEELRGAGLSGNKAASVTDLAAKVLDGTVVLDPAGLAAEDDEEVVERLTTVRGIGRWTAEMFLMFQLRRLDVWPTGDLGVRRGFGLAWGIPMPTPKQLGPLGEPFRPYRSVTAWYCWRACELPGQASSPLTR